MADLDVHPRMIMVILRLATFPVTIEIYMQAFVTEDEGRAQEVR
ncbi:hypothetical protein [Nocardia sp. NRRL S-836]|nr:hypothetical protein [Nocardia sp. NRRL S-836]